MSVLDYFRLRKAWDAKERVASAGVVLLKEAKSLYAGKQYQELYERWSKGTATDSEVMGAAHLYKDTKRVTFRTFLCGASLKVFLDPLARSAEISRDAAIGESVPQISYRRSIQISGP